MKRIAEPDLMNDKEQAAAYAATDFSEPHDNFVRHFSRCFPDFVEGSVLDLGCGTADVTIRFALHYKNADITGIDGATAMLDIGMHDVQAKNLSGRIKLLKRFLPDKDLTCSNFDAIISNSLLHHLKEPLVLWDTAKRCIGTGKPVFIMDLYRPDSITSAEKLVKQHAEEAPEILKKDFYNSLLASYNISEVKHQLKQCDLDFLKVENISDRHMIIWGQSE